MTSALVMEGGAMRGMFTCGVIDTLMSAGVTFPAAAGISAGAVFGCNIKSRQPGRALRYNMKYCRDPRYCSLRSLLRTGDLYGADFCYRLLPDQLDPFDREAFRKTPWSLRSAPPMCAPAAVSTTPALTAERRTCSGSGLPPPCRWCRGPSR